MNIIVQKLEHPIHAGDWHDKPLKWSVIGPDKEVQNFVTKKDAEIYRICRKRTNSRNEASQLWFKRIK